MVNIAIRFFEINYSFIVFENNTCQPNVLTTFRQKLS